MSTNDNDLQISITHALSEMASELGDKFDISKINLADLSRRTGISRARLRRIQKNGFKVLPNGHKGKKARKTVLSGFTGVLEEMLRNGISNSSVCYDRLKDLGYKGSPTTVRVFISQHRDLIPPKRQIISPKGNRGRRYSSAPGESFQMDWGFTWVDSGIGSSYRAACFVMVCHHCGKIYIEFFPNAKQENLFIGMIHAFSYMGIPEHVLTDNMKSIVIRRDVDGQPIWQPDYEAFMKTVGFSTRLCKPGHPFTKGTVERMVRFVKENFLAGRVFGTITDLNYEAIRWCDRQNSTYRRAADCVPDEKHSNECSGKTKQLEMIKDVAFYLCPRRIISFDGFVHYDGRRFGVPYWYKEKTCRVKRDGFTLFIYDNDLGRILTTHDVTWSRRDSSCRDQYAGNQPEEHPTMPVKSRIFQVRPGKPSSGFEKFNFEEGIWDE